MTPWSVSHADGTLEEHGTQRIPCQGLRLLSLETTAGLDEFWVCLTSNYRPVPNGLRVDYFLAEVGRSSLAGRDADELVVRSIGTPEKHTKRAATFFIHRATRSEDLYKISRIPSFTFQIPSPRRKADKTLGSPGHCFY